MSKFINSLQINSKTIRINVRNELDIKLPFNLISLVEIIKKIQEEEMIVYYRSLNLEISLLKWVIDKYSFKLKSTEIAEKFIKLYQRMEWTKKKNFIMQFTDDETYYVRYKVKKNKIMYYFSEDKKRAKKISYFQYMFFRKNSKRDCLLEKCG